MIGDELLETLRTIVREFFPRYDFLGRYRYRVISMDGDLAVVQAVRKGAGLPDLPPLPVVAGVAGVIAKLSQSAIVLVEFIEGDERYPIITGFSRDGGDTFVPVSLTVDARDLVRIGASAAAVELAGGEATVIREGDQVEIAPGNGSGPVTGTIALTAGGSRVKA
ncbi:hypothetical protein [Sorangium sp. So ce1151]|uniref:hypothetical protein n=1 Tax=Sorangium sp. So ce1151 TaxID=3133332 RepID=UPI003F63A5A0